MNTGKLGIIAAQLMEKLAEESDPDDNEKIGEVMILAEIRGTDEDGPYSLISFRCSDPREWIQYGMLHAALELQRQPGDLEDDDAEE